MFYVIEKKYVGPNQDQDQHLDSHTYSVSTEPERGNFSGELVLNGYCGTTDDWARYAHGEFESQNSAEAWIESELHASGYREDSQVGMPGAYDEGIVARYRVGQYEPLGADASTQWAEQGIRDDITAETTDEEITDLIETYQDTCHSDLKAALDEDAVRDAMQEHREQLQEALML